MIGRLMTQPAAEQALSINMTVILPTPRKG
jgi:hypothetical protein